MYAIKIIDKKALKGKEDSLENEIRVLKRYLSIYKVDKSKTKSPIFFCFLSLLLGAIYKRYNIPTKPLRISRLDHRNVVKLLEAYESRTCVYLVMEL